MALGLFVIPGRDEVANYDVRLRIGESRAAISGFRVRRWRVAPE